MHILAIISGPYGERHVENIRAHGPAEWEVEVWRAPAVLPPIVDSRSIRTTARPRSQRF